MRIQHIEIGNFRKLRAVRIDFAKEKTIFVGANNSGKSSAMVALSHFLVDTSVFTITDFTLSHWRRINDDATAWEEAALKGEPIPNLDWAHLLPYLDVWLNVPLAEIHHVQKLLPTIDWEGGLLGVRLRFQPKDAAALQREYLKARAEIRAALASRLTIAVTGIAEKDHPAPHIATALKTAPATEPEASTSTSTYTVALWPQTMTAFLERKLQTTFTIESYLLDPDLLVIPADGHAAPQPLHAESEPITGKPFQDLICIDEISAQRGFGHSRKKAATSERGRGPEKQEVRGGTRRLSTQLRSYYDNHLDPFERPDAKDLEALEAIERAQKTFDARLTDGFSAALKELEGLNYPGVTDPKLTISTRINPTDGLSHDAAVQYEVPSSVSQAPHTFRLPEDSNGLGYQNLVSMAFHLMSFRDAWMKVRKAGTAVTEEAPKIPPLHLVLIEEPEAHLHAQVQQVFINEAYAILRRHPKLGKSEHHHTQLVVSTHSSHVAHECDFSSLRYFRRIPATTEHGGIPITSVINLSEVFGPAGKTKRFVARYLKATHADLFFADAAILIEGPAERIVVPYLVTERVEYEFLRRSYVTWLEIGGSHAHRLKELVEHLGLTVLIITDIDAKDGASGASVQPKRSSNQKARNETLRKWVPELEAIDDLLDLSDDKKVKTYNPGFSVRVAYQQPIRATLKKADEAEALANTFEDALVFENLPIFSALAGTGLVAKFKKSIDASETLEELGGKLFVDLQSGGKAEFALDLLDLDTAEPLKMPAYIHKGLDWLTEQLQRKQHDVAVEIESLVEAVP